ncbi:MAG TPA: hypothetical protein VL404_05105, partial [Candidatus Eisenbacteria bacterium]|nr:hypothetical protein [Candidatus Eisenbacteria bacterium]
GYRALLVGLVIFNPAYLYFSTEARSYMPAAARCETALKRTVLCLTVAPLFLIALLSFVIPKSFVERAIFSGYPFFWCVVVFGISRIRSAAVRRGLAALVAGVAVLATFAFLAEKDSLVTVASPKNDWRGVTEFLARRGALDGAESCVLSDIPLVGVRYYLKRRGLPVGDPIAYQRKIMREKIAAVFPGGAARSAEPPKEPPIYQVTGASALRELVAGHRDFYLIRDPVRSRNYRKIQNGLAASGLIDYDRTYCFKGVEIDVFHRKKT